MRRKITTFFVILLLIGCERHHKEFEKISLLEEQHAPARQFSTFAMHNNREVQKRTAIALGRLQDQEAVPMLMNFLESSNSSVRVEAVFGLGQLGFPAVSKFLINYLSIEKDLEVRLQLIETFSKIADNSTIQSIDSVLTQLLSDDIPIVRGETALAIARLVHRGFKHLHWSEKLLGLLADDGEEVRWRSAYALMRLADPTTAPALRQTISDRNSKVRMQTIKATGLLGDRVAISRLQIVAQNDSDWRVRINAINALGRLIKADETEISFLTKIAIADNHLHVRLTALQTLGNVFARLRKKGKMSVTKNYTDFLITTYLQDPPHKFKTPATIDEQIYAACALAQVDGQAALNHLELLAQNSDIRIRVGAVRALGMTHSYKALESLQKLFNNDSSLVKMAVLEALSKISANQYAMPIYLRALKSNDPTLVAIAAQKIAANTTKRDDHVSAIISAYDRIAPSVDLITAEIIFNALADCGNPVAQNFLESKLDTQSRPFAMAIAKALKKLTGKNYDDRLPKEFLTQRLYSYDKIQKLKGSWAKVSTSIGIFELQFFPEEAPLAVLNFIHLVEKDFFNGIAVHKIIPNDRMEIHGLRRDTVKAPEYSIHSQINRLRFVRGMVGMARSDIGTESHKWFITYSNQPQLDGHYTIFARVRKGMEVVDQLQTQHMIQDITITY